MPSFSLIGLLLHEEDNVARILIWMMSVTSQIEESPSSWFSAKLGNELLFAAVSYSFRMWHSNRLFFGSIARNEKKIIEIGKEQKSYLFLSSPFTSCKNTNIISPTVLVNLVQNV